MKRASILCAVLSLSLLLPLASSVWADNELRISCEGIESTGGGTRRYQYELWNPSTTDSVTLTNFYVGTQDLNAANYSSWIAPAGFTAVATIDTANNLSLSDMYTTLTKTPHGQLIATPGGNDQPTPGVILWTGSLVIPPQGTAIFGFNHPYRSWDTEWLAADGPPQTAATSGMRDDVIAGPIGVFSQGWVHGPGEPLQGPALSPVGIGLLVAAVFGLAAWLLLRRRKGLPRPA